MYKKKKKKRKGIGAVSTTKSGGLQKWYADKDAKKSLPNTGLKALLDIVGATTGAGLGAATGLLALPVGAAVFGLGHYFGDSTGISRVAGAAAMGYGIAKAIENQHIANSNQLSGLAGEKSKAAQRLNNFWDELQHAFRIKKVEADTNLVDQTSPDGDPSAVSGLDLSALDAFDRSNEAEAEYFQSSQLFEDQQPESFADQINGMGQPSFDLDEQVAPEFVSAVIADQPDLTHI